VLNLVALRQLRAHSFLSTTSYLRLRDRPLPRPLVPDTTLPMERRSIHTHRRHRHYIKAIPSVLLRERHPWVTSMRDQ
jgi:hypothetical protein